MQLLRYLAIFGRWSIKFLTLIEIYEKNTIVAVRINNKKGIQKMNNLAKVVER
jgi:hypothetical protein